jgi:acyl dehydratase
VDRFKMNDRGMHFGTVEDARALLGVPQPPKVGQVPVDLAMIRLFCGMVEDGNPSFWDDEFAERTWGGVPSPPPLLFTWTLPLPWNPATPHRDAPLCVRVPLPGTQLANAKQGAEFFEPIMVGDRLSMIETLTDLSEEKSTRLGHGHFITTRAEFTRDGDDEIIATLTNTLFRYTPAENAE